jgi:hypothetical protein
MSAYGCLICPPLRRELCLVPCTPEIAEARAKRHQEVEETELRFTPPVRPARELKPFYRDGVVARSIRHETVDKLR